MSCTKALPTSCKERDKATKSPLAPNGMSPMSAKNKGLRWHAYMPSQREERLYNPSLNITFEKISPLMMSLIYANVCTKYC